MGERLKIFPYASEGAAGTTSAYENTLSPVPTFIPRLRKNFRVFTYIR